MLQKYTLSQFGRTNFSCFSHIKSIFFLALTLTIFLYTSNIYSAQVTLAWEPNTENDLAGYKIYYGKLSGNYDSNVDVGYQTSYTLSGFTSGETYFFAATAYDFSGNESEYSNEAIYTTGIPVTWVDTAGVAVNGNYITKNASMGWGNGGAASLETFAGDGGVKFVVTQTNTFRMCGLSSANPDDNWASIEYAIFLLTNGRIRVYESGVYKGNFGSYKIGDRFTVERVGSAIVYKKNDAVFYTSVTPTDAGLMVDCSIYNGGGEISDAIFVDITPGVRW